MHELVLVQSSEPVCSSWAACTGGLLNAGVSCPPPLSTQWQQNLDSSKHLTCSFAIISPVVCVASVYLKVDVLSFAG